MFVLRICLLKTSGLSKSPFWFFLDIRIRFVLLPTFGILGTEVWFFENSLLVFRGLRHVAVRFVIGYTGVCIGYQA